MGTFVHAPSAHPVTHEKTIVQSRDRQGADPLANARGSLCASIFGAFVHAPMAHPSRMKRRLLRAATVRERIRLLTRAALSVHLFSKKIESCFFLVPGFRLLASSFGDYGYYAEQGC